MQSIIYVLLSIILAFIIAYIIWKFTKPKIIKRKQEKLEAKKLKEALSLYYEFILTYNLIINYTENELAKFEAKTTDYKMGQIKLGAKRLLNILISREDFAIHFHGDKKYEEFVTNAELITLTQANLWAKKIPNVIDFFKDQYKHVPEGERKHELEQLTNESIERKFYEE
ncbi:hypothetical protein OF364_00735 [Mycoplasma enhydrae]|uniref:MHJ_0274 family protein n=1 Tax=Mycoplasma enhydrae TaxID=2499220 RepID=UPI00197BC4BE|nr:hypothetical protein [Mycoplasma enhydrae]MBN4089480.1 hypothetical protein [Mycoplasma enhydrae]MCV3733675.1 hypothetical protein [Mycoplasma enhydrae]MCV3753344.1 hypothetical protein [Mycoplasma enhydrae]